jgi:putative Mg2+ transporter-C (MgtC) family protein
MGIETVFISRLVVAAILGGLLGIERSIAGKHAGMRTYALVSLGSALFSSVGLISAFQLNAFNGLNPVQIASSVVIGIGFIGAGLAAYKVENHVELTTAAGVWLVAAVGMASGFGYYALAITTTLLGIFIFSLLAKLELRISTKFGTRHEE